MFLQCLTNATLLHCKGYEGERNSSKNSSKTTMKSLDSNMNKKKKKKKAAVVEEGPGTLEVWG